MLSSAHCIYVIHLSIIATLSQDVWAFRRQLSTIAILSGTADWVRMYSRATMLSVSSGRRLTKSLHGKGLLTRPA